MSTFQYLLETHFSGDEEKKINSLKQYNQSESRAESFQTLSHFEIRFMKDFINNGKNTHSPGSFIDEFSPSFINQYLNGVFINFEKKN